MTALARYRGLLSAVFFICITQMSRSTYINWDVEINGQQHSLSLTITGNTCEYCNIDWYADRGGIYKRTSGLAAGRDRYRQLVERFGPPTQARCDF